MKMKFAAGALAAALLSAGPALAQVDKLKLADVIQTITFSGDLRLRNDLRNRKDNNADASQQRYRLRFGFEAQLPDDLKVVTRLASGTGEQVSTNQTGGKLASQKGIWIDTTFLKWTPTINENATAYAIGGRMINPLWRPYAADIVWDDDLNPEGLAEGGEWLLPDLGVSVFANALQWVTDQDSNSGKNQWEFSQQAGFEKTLPMESRLRMGAAYHKWSDENRSTENAAVVQDGNRRSASGVLLNRFGVGELSAQLSSWAGALPVSAQATLIRNYRARDNGTTITGPTARDGYQFGAILGAAKVKGSWEAAYFRKYSQADSTVADAADSDFGDGGTNRKGHIAWFAYNPRDWMQLKVKGFVTDVIDTSLKPNKKPINRLQTDVSIKF